MTSLRQLSLETALCDRHQPPSDLRHPSFKDDER